MKKRIALLYGGEKSEHDVSVMGYKYVSSLLKGSPYEILPVYITKMGEWYVGDKSQLRAYPCAYGGGGLYTEDGYVRIDCVLPLLHGRLGEDGSLQGALDIMGVPYVGADVCTGAVSTDKHYAKLIVSSLGIPTIDSVVFSSFEDTEAALGKCKERLGFPMFIKPRRLGSSVGAYPVYDEEDFQRCFPLSMKEGANLVIAERMLEEKRELECAFLEMGGKRIITEPGEIHVSGFYGFGEKYGGQTRVSARADIRKEYAERVSDYAERIAEALRLRHLARIDFFLSDGTVYFNEVNTFPGFTENSLYPKMLEASGIPPRDAILSFIEDALAC